MLGDIRNRRLLYAKGVLFVALGGIASALLLIDQPSLRTAALLATAVWSFCRAYYFAFYVIEKYADPTFRFSGLFAFFRYAMSRHREP